MHRSALLAVSLLVIGCVSPDVAGVCSRYCERFGSDGASPVCLELCEAEGADARAVGCDAEFVAMHETAYRADPRPWEDQAAVAAHDAYQECLSR